jgi:hypothetical protein
MDKLEAVAKAICEASGELWKTGKGLREPFASNAERMNNHWRFKARAALSAIPDERAAIVAYLRAEHLAIRAMKSPVRNLDDVADAIERGDHLSDSHPTPDAV